MERVEDTYHEPGKVHYIPHREVSREESSTTKLRIVCDASARIKKGPCMLPNIFDIIIRFRCFKYAVTSDIKSAFLNIRVSDIDRDCLRFL